MKVLVTESQFRKMIMEMSREEIDQKANETNINPTEAQKEASNYKMGHIRVKGFNISIENPKGSKRYFNHGKKFVVMKNHYGYFSRTKGKDGDQVDVFIGPDTDDFNRVYVVDQKINGKFDESKVMLGFKNKKEAKAAYFANYEENWHGFMHITGVSIALFKKWLYRGRKQRQPFADYVEIQKKKLDESISQSYDDGNLWKPVRREDGEMNLVNSETGEYLSPEWFNWIGYPIDGISVVRNDESKYNYLNEEGRLLLDFWCDDAEEFRNGEGYIAVDEIENGEPVTYYNRVDKNGNLLGEFSTERDDKKGNGDWKINKENR